MIILNNLIQEHTAVTSQLESPLFTSVLPLRLTKIPLKTNIKKKGFQSLAWSSHLPDQDVKIPNQMSTKSVGVSN